MLVMAKLVPLPLFNATVWGALVVPTNWSAKIRIVLDREMPGAKPIPVRVITGTLPRASLVMATPPVLKPAVVGLKVTLMVQLAPAATLLPQLLAWAKSPLAAMLAMFNTAVPLLVSVDVWDGLVVPMSRLPKIRLVLDKVMTGARIPTPVRDTTWGLPGALSVTAIDPSREPTAVGVKATVMMQLAPGARLLPQVSVGTKSRVVGAILVMVSTPVPLLVRVTVCGGLVAPTGWLTKVRFVVESVTRGPLTVVTCVAVLFAGLGSTSLAVTLAVLVIVPVEVGLTTIVIVARAALASGPRLHTTMLVPVQLP